VGFGPWGFESLRPHRIDLLGAVAQLAKAPVSKTGDSRFESWLPRSLSQQVAVAVGAAPDQPVGADLGDLVEPPSQAANRSETIRRRWRYVTT
jgi:hypothetical protein